MRMRNITVNCEHCKLKKSVLLFGYHHDPRYYHNQNTVFISKNEWNITSAKDIFTPANDTQSRFGLCVCVYVQIKWCRDWDECVHNIQPSSAFNVLGLSQSALLYCIWVYLEPMAADCLSYENSRVCWRDYSIDTCCQGCAPVDISFVNVCSRETWGNWNMSTNRTNQWIHPSKSKWHKLFACSFIHFMQIEWIRQKIPWRWLLKCGLIFLLIHTFYLKRKRLSQHFLLICLKCLRFFTWNIPM